MFNGITLFQSGSAAVSVKKFPRITEPFSLFLSQRLQCTVCDNLVSLSLHGSSHWKHTIRRLAPTAGRMTQSWLKWSCSSDVNDSNWSFDLFIETFHCLSQHLPMMLNLYYWDLLTKSESDLSKVHVKSDYKRLIYYSHHHHIKASLLGLCWVCIDLFHSSYCIWSQMKKHIINDSCIPLTKEPAFVHDGSSPWLTETFSGTELPLGPVVLSYCDKSKCQLWQRSNIFYSWLLIFCHSFP